MNDTVVAIANLMLENFEKNNPKIGVEPTPESWNLRNTWTWAKTIGGAGGFSEREQLILELAAVLHNIRSEDDGSKDPSERDGSVLVREFLRKHPEVGTLDDEIVDEVCWLIGVLRHNGMKKLRLLNALMFADFLGGDSEPNTDVFKVVRQAKNIFKKEGGSALLENLFPGV